MHRVPFLSRPTNESDSGDELRMGVNEDKDMPLGNSRSSVPQTSQKAVPRSWFPSTTVLRAFSVVLHTALIIIHIALLLVWSKGLEHRAVFSLDQQRRVSLIITAVTTTFGTTYSALMVFVTQTLFMRRSLQITQPLTAIHDTSAAWTGLGSAVLHLWRQTTVAGSAVGVLTALLYLGNILVLHISSPALFSVVAFNTSISVPVGTQGHLPVFNWSDSPVDDIVNTFDPYVKGALYFLPSILGNTTSLGLHGGTLYDVLDANEGLGNVQVNATGFNVTCGYPSFMKSSFSGASRNWLWWSVALDGNSEVVYEFPTTRKILSLIGCTLRILTSPGLTEADMIRPAYTELIEYPPNLVLYTTISVVDSTNTHPPLLKLDPVTNDSLSSVQIMECDLTLVPQRVVLEARTQRVVDVTPDITKNTSAWTAYTGPPSTDYIPDSTGNSFTDLWMHWYTLIPFVDFEFSTLVGDNIDNPWQDTGASPDGSSGRAYASDVYLIQQLNLHGPNATYSPNDTVTLHDLENAVSRLLAAMFWSTANFLPFVGAQTSSPITNLTEDITISQLSPVENHVLPFERGTAMVMGDSTLGRLDSSLVAIIAGLVASILLALLALPSIFFNRDNEIPVDGTGVLQAIWMYRNHPELEVLLPQVEHPTTEQLREAGMMLRIAPLAAALVALKYLPGFNAQKMEERNVFDCGDDSCNGNSHTRSSSGSRPTGSSTILRTGGISTEQSAVIALAVVLSVVVFFTLASLLWWEVRRRRRGGYTGTQPYIDEDPGRAPVMQDPAPPYVLPAVEPFPLPRSAECGAMSVENDEMAKKRAAGLVLSSYPPMEGMLR
ncbi:hypothetical protein C8R46DRAFT_1356047 [Mycena filopes]|nr:hypothetical protein C8R46DRAFT_1356047 [Mycena filopes]